MWGIYSARVQCEICFFRPALQDCWCLFIWFNIRCSFQPWMFPISVILSRKCEMYFLQLGNRTSQELGMNGLMVNNTYSLTVGQRRLTNCKLHEYFIYYVTICDRTTLIWLAYSCMWAIQWYSWIYSQVLHLMVNKN